MHGVARRGLWHLGWLVPAVVAGVLLFRPTEPDERSARRDRPPSGAMQAMESWAAARAYPGRVIPDVGFAAAALEARLARGGGIDDLVAPWTSLGPNNIGGRTLALALRPGDPNVIFAGSASGGLWKSTTGGVGADAWDRVDTGFPELSVSSIEIDANDPDLMYAGTGEVYAYQGSIGGDVVRTTRGSYGIGILKTTDGGATWALSLDWTLEQTRGIWAVRIDPTDANVVFAATTEGVYRSTNAGSSWQLVNPVIMGMDLRFHPTNAETLYAAHGSFGSTGFGIYRTLDGGDTWFRVSAGLPLAWTGKAQLSVSPASANIVYASIADDFAGVGLYRSTDAGATWQLRNSVDYPQYQGWYSHYVAVSPFDANDLFVGGIEIWRSTNGGTAITELSDWTSVFFGTPPPEGPGGGPQYAHADHHAAIPHPTDPNAFFFASDGGVFKTTDNGNTFVGLNGGYVSTQFYHGFASAAANANRAIGGLQDNFTAIYDGTTSWRRVIGGDGCMAAINPLNENRMFGCYQYLGLLRSTNGGSSWSNAAPSDPGGETAFVAPFVLCPSNPVVLYAGRERVYRSTNEGSSWTAMNGGAALSPGNPVISMGVSPVDQNLLYVGTAPLTTTPKVFRSTNGGTSFTNVTGPLPDRYPMAIEIVPGAPITVYVAFGGFGTSHLFRTTDAGATWSDVGAGLPDVPVSAITVDPENTSVLYAGLDLGVYVSLDAGASWQPFLEGMPTALVNDLVIFAPDRKLRAATHGNGVFERALLPAATDAPQLAAATPQGLSVRVIGNPVYTNGSVEFEVPREGIVRLEVIDVRGRRVATLVDERRARGSFTEELPRDLAPGVYFVRLAANGGVRVAKAVVTTR